MKELTIAQAERVLCPVLSRGEYTHNCRGERCMGWEWSSQLPKARVSRPVGDATHLDELERPQGDGWELASMAEQPWIARAVGTDGTIRRSYNQDVPGAERCVQNSRLAIVYWERPWDDNRLGFCALCVAKVTEIEVNVSQ